MNLNWHNNIFGVSITRSGTTTTTTTGLEVIGPMDELHLRDARLVRQQASARQEGVLERILEQVGDVRHVDVRVAKQTARKVGRVVVGAEDAAELRVVQGLCLEPETNTKG